MADVVAFGNMDGGVDGRDGLYAQAPKVLPRRLQMYLFFCSWLTSSELYKCSHLVNDDERKRKGSPRRLIDVSNSSPPVRERSGHGRRSKAGLSEEGTAKNEI